MTHISSFNLLDSGSSIVWARAGFSSNVFCAADDQKRIMLYKLHKMTPKMTLTGSPSDIQCISFSSDDKQVYAGTDGGTVYGWDLSSTKYSFKLQGHKTVCNFIEVNSEPEDAHLLITGSGDCSVKIWDLRTGKAAQTLRNHTSAVNCAKFSPDSNWIASGGNDGNTYITDYRSEKVVYWFEEQYQKITSLEFHPKTYTLTTGCAGKWINYYDLENFQIINTMAFNTSTVKAIEFYDKEEFDLVEWGFFGSDDYIRMINWEKNEQAYTYKIPSGILCDLKIQYKNNLLTCLWSYKNEMVLFGVNLPQISDEVDMDVDSIPTSDHQPPYDVHMEDRSDPMSYKPSFEENKMSEDFMNKAVVHPKKDDYRVSSSSHAVPQAMGDNLDKTSFSNLSSLDKTTFRPNPESGPADLDYNEFASKPSSPDFEYIEKIQDKHFHFLDTLRQRNQKVKNIISLYNPYANVTLTMNALGQMNDMGVNNDIWSSLFVKGKFVENLSVKQCLQAIPYWEGLFNAKHENHVVTGAMSIHKILKHIGRDIINIRNYPVTKGVDLQREERIKNCNELLDRFRAVFKGSTLKKRVKYKGNIGKVSKNLSEELYQFLALANDDGGNDGQPELA